LKSPGAAATEVISVPEGFGPTLSARLQGATHPEALVRMPTSADIIGREGAPAVFPYSLICKDATGAA